MGSGGERANLATGGFHPCRGFSWSLPQSLRVSLESVGECVSGGKHGEFYVIYLCSTCVRADRRDSWRDPWLGSETCCLTNNVDVDGSEILKPGCVSELPTELFNKYRRLSPAPEVCLFCLWQGLQVFVMPSQDGSPCFRPATARLSELSVILITAAARVPQARHHWPRPSRLPSIWVSCSGTERAVYSLVFLALWSLSGWIMARRLWEPSATVFSVSLETFVGLAQVGRVMKNLV